MPREAVPVWACGVPNFLPPDVAARTLANLTDDAFWTERGQRDLLLSLKTRWTVFDAAQRSEIEARLLKGPKRLDFMTLETFRQWRGRTVLDRVLWLVQQGCTFERNIDATIAKGRAAVPSWKDEYAAHAADSHEGTGGIVSVIEDFDAVEEGPIADLLGRCISAGKRNDATFTNHDPIAGLAAGRPIRLLRAILLETLPDDQSHRWAWSKFLQSPARREDSPRLTCLIAHRLIGIPEITMALIEHPVSYWLEERSVVLYEVSRLSVTALIDRLLAALASHQENDGEPQKRPGDWLSAAHSSPSGHAVQAMLLDPVLPTCLPGSGLPESWKRRMEICLAQAGDNGPFALHQIARHVGWLSERDPEWVETEILSALNTESERRDAVLSAFLNNQSICNRILYERFKEPTFKLISGELAHPTVDIRALTQFILAGWLTSDAEGRLLSDVGMRSALVRGSQELRTTMLWQIEQWDFADKHYFLSNVWPLQLAARSPIVTERLVSIAIKDGAHFRELAEAIMPFLTQVRHGALMFAAELDNANEILAASPDIALEMYWRIMPEDSAEWPYEAHRGLEYLYENVKAVRTHPHMVDLMRRRRKGYF